MDALTKAYELGAPYSTASITILLKSGTHYMLRSTYGYYMPTKSDKNH